MSYPGTYRRHTDALPANVATGVPSAELSTAAFDRPTHYSLRLFVRLGAGTAAAITVAHNFYISDGFADGERLVTLTTSLASGLEDTAYALVDGLARDFAVRVESVPSAAPAAGRSLVVSSAVGEY